MHSTRALSLLSIVSAVIVLSACPGSDSPPAQPAAGTGGAQAMAGASAGMSAAAGAPGAGASGPLTCAAADKAASPSALHAAVVTALLPATPADTMNGLPCAFSACHAAGPKKAGLILDGTKRDLN